MASLFNLPTRLFPHQNRLTGAAYGVLVLFCLAIFLPGFFTLPVIDRDEALFAQSSKQMLQTGDLIDIRFQDEARNKKPEGIYWLQAGAAKMVQNISGIEENIIWPYRLPSLLGAILAVLLTAAIGSKILNAEMGFAAGILLACTVLLNSEARLAKTDAMLLATILACQFVLAKAFMQTKALKTKDFLLFWLSLAAGFLIKGPIVLLAPMGTLLALKCFKEDIGFARKLKPLFGLPLALALILPWFFLIAQHTDGAFYKEAAGQDLFAKIWQVQSWEQHWGLSLPGLYAVIMPLTLWPASLPFMLAIPYLWASRHDRDVRFCIAWVLPIWLLFEVTLTKLPHYVLPAYPALCLLAMRWLFSGVRDSGRPLWNNAVYLIFGAVSVVLALLPVVAPIKLEGTLFYWAMMLATLALAAALACIQLFRRNTPVLGLAPLPVAGFTLMLSLFTCMLPNLPHLFLSEQIIQNLPQIPNCQNAALYAGGYSEPSLVFLSNREVKFYNVGERVSVEMKRHPCAIGIVDDEQLPEFIEKSPGFGLLYEETATVSGFNYGRGHNTTLHIFRTK